MNITAGNLYFVSDSFFEKVSDPFLKINYETSQRPHYFSFREESTGLYWLVPCSSKVDKFMKIIKDKKDRHKPTDGIRIVTIQDQKSVLLFQDMFPSTVKYIQKQYIRGGQPVCVSDPNIIKDLEKTAKKVIKLLRHGVRFTPTQPDVKRIEKLMSDELIHDQK